MTIFGEMSFNSQKCRIFVVSENGHSMFSLSFFFKKNNPGKPAILDEGKKRMGVFPTDLTILDPQEMARIEGGRSNAQLLTELRKLASSCGDTIPQ